MRRANFLVGKRGFVWVSPLIHRRIDFLHFCSTANLEVNLLGETPSAARASYIVLRYSTTACRYATTLKYYTVVRFSRTVPYPLKDT